MGLVLRAGVFGEVEPQVAMGDLVRIADCLDVAAVEQHRPVAELLHRAHVVGHEDDRAVGPHLVEDVAALLLEGGVADREHLVDQHDVGVRLDHHGEGQPHEHPRGVVLELQLGELLELGELDHRGDPVLRLLAREAHHHPVEDHVLARGQVDVEAHPELDERRHPASHPDRPGVRAVDAGEDLQQRALTGPVAPDDAEELPLVDVEGDAAQRHQLARRPGRERVEDPLLDRVDPLERDLERLCEVANLDHNRARAHQRVGRLGRR